MTSLGARELLRKSAAIKAEFDASTALVINVIPVGKKWFVVPAVGAETLNGFESQVRSSREDAVALANELAAELGTNEIRVGGKS